MCIRDRSKRLALKTLALADHRQFVFLIVFERTLVLSGPRFIDFFDKPLERRLSGWSTVPPFVNVLANLCLSLLRLDLVPCFGKSSPITDSADTERVVPS